MGVRLGGACAVTTIREALTGLDAEGVCDKLGLDPDGDFETLHHYLLRFLDKSEQSKADTTRLLAIIQDQIEDGWIFAADELATIKAIRARQ